ncbi:Uncharacterised protein [Mycobacterium tuberculosis]|uniref:Uncharacterized protein n=1 Tax=Mycobacterium tuberculosis TaxID=1773 RepID=A0A916PCZ9_MYCTX|nr:Uncharacterised protein [Mycobacterium tuberculosis]COZ66778.1 Uncharacterised protein [Mycobacterium tuberculosis]
MGRSSACSLAVTVRATAVAIRVSVSNGRWGPCCSVDPSGITIDGDVLGSWLDVALPSSPTTGTRRW